MSETLIKSEIISKATWLIRRGANRTMVSRILREVADEMEQEVIE